MSSYCSQCGTATASSDQYCSACGARIARQSETDQPYAPAEQRKKGRITEIRSGLFWLAIIVVGALAAGIGGSVFDSVFTSTSYDWCSAEQRRLDRAHECITRDVHSIRDPFTGEYEHYTREEFNRLQNDRVDPECSTPQYERDRAYYQQVCGQRP